MSRGYFADISDLKRHGGKVGQYFVYYSNAVNNYYVFFFLNFNRSGYTVPIVAILSFEVGRGKFKD